MAGDSKEGNSVWHSTRKSESELEGSSEQDSSKNV